MLRPGTSLRTTETVVGCTPRCSATCFKLTRCCRVGMFTVYYLQTSYRFSRSSSKSICRATLTLSSPAIGSSPDDFASDWEKWNKSPDPSSQLLTELSLLCLGEVKVGQIHVAFEDDVKR